MGRVEAHIELIKQFFSKSVETFQQSDTRKRQELRTKCNGIGGGP